MAKLSSSNGIEKFPKLRFPEFTEEWEEISFSNLFDFLPNNTITRANLSNNGAIRNIHYGDVLIKFGSVLSIRSDDIPFIKNTDTVNNNVFLKNGDIVIADTAEDETVGKVTEIFDIDTEKVVSGLHTIPCRPKKNFAPKFLGYYMNSPAYHYQLFPLMQGVKVLSISKSNIVGTVIHYPDILQQTKITNLLSLIDKKISVQRQLVEALKKYKRGSLSALFPKKGEITPQYRFAGFTKPWEQRKLGDMGSTFNGLSGKTKDDFGHGEAKFITYMNVFSNPIADLTMTESIEIDKKQKSVKAGDVFFTTSSETPDEVGMSSVMPEDADNIYLNSFCFGYRPTEKFDLNYLAYVLRADSFRKEMTFLAQGISRYNISKNKVMEVCIPVPTIEEQTKVGRYFRNLDNLITLHQHKYDTLLSLKNALLQQMFI